MARRKRTMAQKLARPAWRATIPTDQLPAKYRAQRLRNQAVARDNANPLYNPGAQLGGHALAKAVQDLVGLEVDPQVSALDRQAGSEQKQGTALLDRAKGYYTDLQAGDAGRAAMQQAISDRLGASLGKVATDTEGRIQQAAATEQAAAGKDAELRGPGLDGGAQAKLAAELAARSGLAAQSAQGFRSAGALQAASGERLALGLAGANQARGGEQQGQLATALSNRLAEIGGKKADVEGQRGALSTKYLTQLRQTGFENLATLRGLGIRADQVAADAQQSDAQLKLAEQRIAETHRANTTREGQADARLDLANAKFASSSEKDAYQRAHKLGPYARKKGKGESQSALNIKRSVGNALSSYQRYLKAGHSLRWIARKAREQGVPNDVLNAAADLASFGYIRENHAKALRRAGVQLPGEWIQSGAQAYGGPN